MARDPKDRFPPQIKYIIGNEGCERFSFYGMSAILTVHMMDTLRFQEHDAEWIYHLFVFVAYMTPLIGGWIADRWLGKYKTILYLSFGYVAGHGVIAAFEGENGLYLGLALIALGAGGIKPCVSAFVGDQFRSDQGHLVTKVYGLFYWIINFGAFFSQLLTPKLLVWYGPSVAFGVPGVLMALALVIFVLGKRHYKVTPPTGPNPHSFLKVVWYALTNRNKSKLGDFFSTAESAFPKEAVDGARAVCRIALVFAPVPAFFALFYQYGSTWVVQATKCDLYAFGLKMEASQISALNGVFVLGSIPLLTRYVYPYLQKRGMAKTALSRMQAGMYLAIVSFVCAAILEAVIVAGGFPNALWQTPQYLFLSVAEVLVSATALEFAYTEAPPTMKSSIMGVWFVVIAVGSLLAGVVAKLNAFSGPVFYLFFAALMLVAAVIFTFLAMRFKSIKFGSAAPAA
jgi:proton-dependent oligopeptide transporter, POT family